MNHFSRTGNAERPCRQKEAIGLDGARGDASPPGYGQQALEKFLDADTLRSTHQRLDVERDMTHNEATKRHAALADEIRRHDHAYYVLAQPVISDQQYDRLYRELVDLETT